MLVLSRQRDESIIIGDNIVITIADRDSGSPPGSLRSYSARESPRQPARAERYARFGQSDFHASPRFEGLKLPDSRVVASSERVVSAALPHKTLARLRNSLNRALSSLKCLRYYVDILQQMHRLGCVRQSRRANDDPGLDRGKITNRVRFHGQVP